MEDNDGDGGFSPSTSFSEDNYSNSPGGYSGSPKSNRRSGSPSNEDTENEGEELELETNIKVAVRCRPLSTKENAGIHPRCVEVNEDHIKLCSRDPKKFKDEIFPFDMCFGEDTTQEEIYNRVAKPLLEKVFKGFDVTLFAYGQTGSGKTHTMSGPEDEEYNEDNMGIIPRFVRDMFQRVNQEVSAHRYEKRFTAEELEAERQRTAELEADCKAAKKPAVKGSPGAGRGRGRGRGTLRGAMGGTRSPGGSGKRTRMRLGEKSTCTVWFSITYIEIYLERVYDLLSENTYKLRQQGLGEKAALPKMTGFKLPITPLMMRTEEEVMENFIKGTHHRVTGKTNMNEHSSRSHAIFTITMNKKIEHFDLYEVDGIERWEPRGKPDIVVSKVNMVDLAGSENLKMTGATAQTKDQGIAINKGLSDLGMVINKLSEKNRADYMLATMKATGSPTADDSGNGTSSKLSDALFRASPLVRVLRDSLIGKAYTVMIAAISPATSNFVYTRETLRYSSKARTITIKPRANVEKDRVRELEEVVRKLKEEIKSMQAANPENMLEFRKQFEEMIAANRAAGKSVLVQDEAERVWRNYQNLYKLHANMKAKLDAREVGYMLVLANLGEAAKTAPGGVATPSELAEYITVLQEIEREFGEKKIHQKYERERVVDLCEPLEDQLETLMYAQDSAEISANGGGIGAAGVDLVVKLAAQMAMLRKHYDDYLTCKQHRQRLLEMKMARLRGLITVVERHGDAIARKSSEETSKEHYLTVLRSELATSEEESAALHDDRGDNDDFRNLAGSLAWVLEERVLDKKMVDEIGDDSYELFNDIEKLKAFANSGNQQAPNGAAGPVDTVKPLNLMCAILDRLKRNGQDRLYLLEERIGKLELELISEQKKRVEAEARLEEANGRADDNSDHTRALVEENQRLAEVAAEREERANELAAELERVRGMFNYDERVGHFKEKLLGDAVDKNAIYTGEEVAQVLADGKAQMELLYDRIKALEAERDKAKALAEKLSEEVKRKTAQLEEATKEQQAANKDPLCNVSEKTAGKNPPHKPTTGSPNPTKPKAVPPKKASPVPPKKKPAPQDDASDSAIDLPNGGTVPQVPTAQPPTENSVNPAPPSVANPAPVAGAAPPPRPMTGNGLGPGMVPQPPIGAVPMHGRPTTAGGRPMPIGPPPPIGGPPPPMVGMATLSARGPPMAPLAVPMLPIGAGGFVAPNNISVLTARALGSGMVATPSAAGILMSTARGPAPPMPAVVPAQAILVSSVVAQPARPMPPNAPQPRTNGGVPPGMATPQPRIGGGAAPPGPVRRGPAARDGPMPQPAAQMPANAPQPANGDAAIKRSPSVPSELEMARDQQRQLLEDQVAAALTDTSLESEKTEASAAKANDKGKPQPAGGRKGKNATGPKKARQPPKKEAGKQPTAQPPADEKEQNTPPAVNNNSKPVSVEEDIVAAALLAEGADDVDAPPRPKRLTTAHMTKEEFIAYRKRKAAEARAAGLGSISADGEPNGAGDKSDSTTDNVSPVDEQKAPTAMPSAANKRAADNPAASEGTPPNPPQRRQKANDQQSPGERKPAPEGGRGRGRGRGGTVQGQGSPTANRPPRKPAHPAAGRQPQPAAPPPTTTGDDNTAENSKACVLM